MHCVMKTKLCIMHCDGSHSHLDLVKKQATKEAAKHLTPSAAWSGAASFTTEESPMSELSKDY